MKTMYAIIATMMLVAMAMSKVDAQLSTNPGESCPEKSGDTYYIGHLGGSNAFLTAWIGTVVVCVCVLFLSRYDTSFFLGRMLCACVHVEYMPVFCLSGWSTLRMCVCPFMSLDVMRGDKVEEGWSVRHTKELY